MIKVAFNVIEQKGRLAKYKKQFKYMQNAPLARPMSPPKVIKVMFDFCATGLWVNGSPEVPERLLPWVPLSVLNQLYAWQLDADRELSPFCRELNKQERLEEQDIHQRIDKRGLQIAQQIKYHLRMFNVSVQYWGESVKGKQLIELQAYRSDRHGRKTKMYHDAVREVALLTEDKPF